MTTRLIIIQSKPDSGRDNKNFRAYLPANPDGVRKPVGVACSSTADPASIGAGACAVKAFKKLNRIDGISAVNLRDRIQLEKHQPGTWLAVLQCGESARPHPARKTSARHVAGRFDVTTLDHITDAELEAEIKRLEERRGLIRRILTNRVLGENAPVLEVDPELFMEAVVNAVMQVFSVQRHEIFSSNRTERAAMARFVAFHIIREESKNVITLTACGNFFNREHGCVLSGLKTMSGRMETSPKFRVQVETAQVLARQNLAKLKTA